MIYRGSGFIKVLRMSFNLFVPFCLTGTNRGLFCQQTALCHEFIAGTERDLYLELTRSSLFPNNKQYSIHVTCSLSLLTKLYSDLCKTTDRLN